MVYKVKWNRTGKEYAVKIIPLDDVEEADEIKQQLEVNIQIGLNHCNIIQLIWVYATKDELQMLMEYVSGGILFDMIVYEEHFTEDKSRYVLKQIINGVEYLHSLWIIHRDYLTLKTRIIK